MSRSRITIVGAAIALAVAYGFWLLEYDNRNVYEDRYTRHSTALSVATWRGWQDTDLPVIARGTSATLVYDFFRHTDHDVRVFLQRAGAPGLQVDVALLQDTGKPARRLSICYEQKDIPPQWTLRNAASFVPGAGRFQLRIDARLAAAAPHPAETALKHLRVEIQRPRRIHWPAFVFFFALTATGALGLAWLLWPLLSGAARSLRQASDCELRRSTDLSPSVALSGLDAGTTRPSGGSKTYHPATACRRFAAAPPEFSESDDGRGKISGPLRMTGAAILGAALIWLFIKGPQTHEVMPFDDRRALGNAALMLDNGFDASQLYFRSRLRPGFISAALPWVRLFRQKLAVVQRTDVDRGERLWQEFDRDDATFGSQKQADFFFPYILYAFLVCPLLYGLYREMGAGPWTAWTGVALAGYAWGCSMEIPVTQSWNLLVNVAAVLAFWRASRDGSRAALAAAALMMSLAILTKTTAITSILPIIGIQTWRIAGSKTGERKEEILSGLLYWAITAVLPLVWCEVFLGGAVSEIARFWDEHLYQQVLQKYPPTAQTWLRDTWRVYNWVLPIVVAGLAWRLIRGLPTPADRFCFLWLLAGLLAFAMPYIFPRFLKYTIPPLAYFGAAGLAGLVSRFGAGKPRLRLESSGLEAKGSG